MRSSLLLINIQWRGTTKTSQKALCSFCLVSPSSRVYCIHSSLTFHQPHGQMCRRGAWIWPGVRRVVGGITEASPPITRWSLLYRIPGHLIRSCWYHRRYHQPFQALNRWCPLFLRSCQCPLCGSWENDLTHRQLLSAAWVILYSHFYWVGGGWWWGWWGA